MRYSVYLILLFILIEIFFRFFFKEFNSSDVSYNLEGDHRVVKGIKSHNYKDKSFERLVIRVENKDDIIQFSDINKIYFLGDSITYGYGVDFNETYHQKLKVISNLDYQIIAASEFGVTAEEIFETITKMDKIISPGDILVYQFNYNDIIPIKKNLNHQESSEVDILKKIKKNTYHFRYKYLNRSVFFQVLQHYASVITNSKEGNCEERGKNALGQYTYTYFSKKYFNESKILWNNFNGSLKNIAYSLEQKQVKFYVLISPISLQLPNHSANNKFKLDINCSELDGREYLLKLLENNNIKFIDPLDKLISNLSSSKDLLFQQFDTNHLNPKGHQLVSESIYETLFN